MANSKINFAGITSYIPEAVTELKDLIKTAAFEHPDFRAMVSIVDEITHGKRVGYYGKLGDIGMKKGATACTLNEITASITTTEKTWECNKWDTRLIWCADDIVNTVAAKGLKKGINRYDMTDTEYMDLIGQLVTEAILELYARVVWFGDKLAANTDDSPAGVITATKDVKYINFVNGLFKQAYGIIAAAPTQRVNLSTYNGQASYAQQKSSLSNANALIAIQNMVLTAPMALRQELLNGNYMIKCTQLLFDKVAANFKAFELESMRADLENGLTGIRIEGVVVTPNPSWDQMINEWENDGTKWHDPYRALLYSVDNALVGVPSISEWGNFEVFYDRKDKKVYIDMEDAVDTKFAQDSLIMFAV